MRIFIFALSLLISSNVFSVEQSPLTKETKTNKENIVLSFDNIALSQLVDMVYSDILEESYMFHSDFVENSKVIKVRLRSTFKRSSLPAFMANLLNSYDIKIEKKPGYLFFRPYLPEEKAVSLNKVIYKPRYRDADYLSGFMDDVKSISPNASTDKASKASYEQPDVLSSLSSKNKKSDVLLLTGTAEELNKKLDLLAELDIPAPQVHVKAFIYQVSDLEREGSALSLALNLLQGRLGVSLGSTVSAGGRQSITLDTGSVDAVFSFLSSDSRFKIISSPSLLVRSGSKSRLVIGTDTPVLSGIAYPGGTNSGAVQNVEYRQSGIIFDVSPVVYKDRIDIDLFQQISDFAETKTGVESSPTLVKKELESKFSLASGQLVVIAGLIDNKTSKDVTFFPFTKFELSDDDSINKSEFLLFLSCELVEDKKLDVRSNDNFHGYIREFPGGVTQMF